MSTKNPPIQNAEAIIESFGGIRPMSREINVPVTTIQGWKKRGVIPGGRRSDIEKAAQKMGVNLGDALSVDLASNNDNKAPAKKSAKKTAKTATKTKATPKKTVKKAVKKTVKSSAQKVEKKAAEKTLPRPEPVQEKPQVKVVAQPSSQASNQAGKKTIEGADGLYDVSTIAPQAAAKNTDTGPNSAAAIMASSEEILKSIEEGNRATLIKTIWIVTGLILLAAGLMALLLWPKTTMLSQQVQEQKQVISALKDDVAAAEKKTSEIGSIEPLAGNLSADLASNLKKEFETSLNSIQNKAQSEVDALQNQARNTQIAFDQMRAEMKQNAQDMTESMTQSFSNKMGEITQSNPQLSAMMERIKDLEKSVPGKEQITNSLNELKGIVGGLDGKMTALESKLSTVQDGKTALGQTLEGVSGQDLQAAAMLIVFSQFRDSLNRETPFEEDLLLLNKMVSDDNTALKESIARLAPHANKGVLSSAALSSEFKGLAGDIVASSLKGEDMSVKDKAMARLNALVKVEKDGELITGNPAQATVVEAQEMLNTGNIEGAVSILETLEGPAFDKVQPFIDKAKASILAGDVQKQVKGMIAGDLDFSRFGFGANKGVNLAPAIKAAGQQDIPLPQPVLKKQTGNNASSVDNTIDQVIDQVIQDIMRDSAASAGAPAGQ